MGTLNTIYGKVDEINRERFLQLNNRDTELTKKMFEFYEKECSKYSSEYEFLKAMENNLEFIKLNDESNIILEEIEKLIVE